MSEIEPIKPCGAPVPPDPGYVDRLLPTASWAMYDFANTIYSGIVVTAYLNIYLSIELGQPKTFFGAANTISMILAAVASPFLGCLPDRTGRTKRYLLVVTAACVACTAALSAPGAPVVMLLALFMASNVAYQVAMVFYNALLPTVASPGRQGTISGWGVALGYIGVIAALLSAQFLLITTEEGDSLGQLSDWKLKGISTGNSDRLRLWAQLRRETGPSGEAYRVELFRGSKMGRDELVASAVAGASLPAALEFEAATGENKVTGTARLERYVSDADGISVRYTYRLTFVWAALLFALATLPLAFFVRERGVASPEPLSLSVAAAGWRGVLKTLRKLPGKRDLFLFLLGYFLCCDVLNMAIQSFGIYLSEVFSFTSGQIMYSLAALCAAAFVSGLVMGKVTDWFGPKRALVGAALCLAATLPCVALVPNPMVAVGVMLVLGAPGLAGLWVAGRKLLIQLSPPETIGEYFGLEGIATKISVLGVLLFVVILDVVPAEGHLNYKVGILSQFIMLGPGIVCLWLIRGGKPAGGAVQDEPACGRPSRSGPAAH